MLRTSTELAPVVKEKVVKAVKPVRDLSGTMLQDVMEAIANDAGPNRRGGNEPSISDPLKVTKSKSIKILIRKRLISLVNLSVNIFLNWCKMDMQMILF